MSNLCIFHGNCPDGFGAAFAVNKIFKEENDSIEFFAGYHGRKPPDVTDKNVFIVDFSYRRDVLIEMAKTAKFITIIDHHKSAELDLKDLDLPNVIVIFDMNKSGAMLAWEYFNPTEPAPKLIEHIQDRDLWKFELSGTNETIAALMMYEFSFDVWETFLNEESLERLQIEGSVLIRSKNKDILQFIKSCLYFTDGFEEFKAIPIINVPHMYASDIGGILSKDKPFSISYYNTPDGRTFNLRSQKEGGVDVSEIATRFGGGGHKNAAGFQVDRLHELYLL